MSLKRREPIHGVLRVAINTGNRALVQHDSDILTGVSPALARRLAGEINARMEPIIYNGAGKVFEDAGRDKWGIGFLAIGPMRAKKIAFTQPYVVIEASFAVRKDAAFKDVADVDTAGVAGGHPVLCLPTRRAEDHLYHQRD